MDPKSVHAYTGRGHAYRAKGDYDQAVADYREALRLNPEDADAKRNLELTGEKRE
jgi:Tfp pilus assembly protein PilF